MVDFPIVFKASVVDNASNALGNIGDSTDTLGGKVGGLGGAFSTAAGVIAGLFVHDALGALKDGISDSINAFADLERTITEITALSGLSGDEAEALGASLEEAAQAAGVEFAVGANAAAQALSSLVKAGLEGEEAMMALNSVLQMSTIEQMNAGEAADLLVGVMGQFKISADDSTRAVDALVNASAAGVDTASDFALGLSYCGGQAASMGFTLEETTAALVEMNNQGIAAEKAGRYLGAMFTDLVKKGDSLGFSIYNTDGSMKSLSEITGLLQAKLETFGTQVERDAYLSEQFSSQSGRAALALLNLGGEGETAAEALAATAEAIGKAGTASDVTGKLLDTTSGSLARMDAKMEEVQIRIGEKLAPVLEKLLDAFMKFIDTVWPALNVALTGVASLLGAVFNAANPEAWLTFCEEIGRGLDAVWKNTLAPILDGMFKPALEAISGAVDALKKAWDGAWNWIGSILGWVWDNIIKPITESIGEVVGVAGGAIDRFKDVWDAAWNAIGDVLKWVWDHTIGPVIDSLKGALDVMGDVAEGLGDIVGGIGDAIGDTMDGIGDAIGDTLGDLFGSGIWEEHLLKMAHYTEENLGAVEDQFESTMKRLQNMAGGGIMVPAAMGASGLGVAAGTSAVAAGSSTVNLYFYDTSISPGGMNPEELMEVIGVEVEREMRRRNLA